LALECRSSSSTVVLLYRALPSPSVTIGANTLAAAFVRTALLYVRRFSSDTRTIRRGRARAAALRESGDRRLGFFCWAGLGLGSDQRFSSIFFFRIKLYLPCFALSLHAALLKQILPCISFAPLRRKPLCC
jgi:hypothetical protein